jgi:hypothetical protein
MAAVTRLMTLVEVDDHADADRFSVSARHEAVLENGHWAVLAETLARHGVVADAQELSRLPHDVVLGERLLARIGRGGAGGP